MASIRLGESLAKAAVSGRGSQVEEVTVEDGVVAAEELGVVLLLGVVVPVVDGTTAGSVEDVVEGATPAGLTIRNCDTVFRAALGGFRIGVLRGTKATVMSSPFLSGTLPRFDVTTVPVLEVGDRHISTWTMAGREPHFWPFLCVIAGPGTVGRVVVVVVDEVVDELVEEPFFDFDLATVVVVVDDVDVVVVAVAFCLTGLPGYRRLVSVSTTPSGERKPESTAWEPSYRAASGERCGSMSTTPPPMFA
jgi:hypothetical protein